MSDKIIVGCEVNGRFVLCERCLHTLFDKGCNKVREMRKAQRIISKFED